MGSVPEGPLLLRLLIATRRFVLRRELLKDAIYMATKAVDKYSRRGYKERRQEGLCCAIDIIDIFDLLWKPSNFSYVFHIIFVGKDVSAFDDCQLQFIT